MLELCVTPLRRGGVMRKAHEIVRVGMSISDFLGRFPDDAAAEAVVRVAPLAVRSDLPALRVPRRLLPPPRTRGFQVLRDEVEKVHRHRREHAWLPG